MTFSDLSDFCRLCLLPLNGSCVDCALDDNAELRDTIKMVYNIDIKIVDEYSTKVCLMCCDILLCNTIHYVRAVEVQKSLSRIQRIKNMLRNFGKKKLDKTEQKLPLPEMPIIDVEMVEIEPNYSTSIHMDYSEMEEQNDCNDIITSHAQTNPSLMWPTINDNSPPNNFTDWDWDEGPVENIFDEEDYVIVPRPKPDIDHNNNNNNNNTNNSPSFFQMAKKFYGNLRNKRKSMGNIEHGMDEITKQLASLQFAF